MIIDNVNEEVTKCIEALGFDVLEIDPHFAFNQLTYKVFIDTIPPGTIDHPTGGVTIDDCAKVSEAVSELLDELDPWQEPYTLEVSSPGVFRELKTEKDWSRALSQRVRAIAKTGKTRVGYVNWFNDKELCIGEDNEIFDRATTKVNMQPILDFKDD